MKLLCVAALALVGIAGVGCHPITESDAEGVLKGAESAAKVPDGEKRMAQLYGTCGVYESCARGCSAALAQNIDPSQRGRQIARCFKDFVKAKDADRDLSVDTWFQRYFDAYLVRSREKLPSADQARVDAVRTKLGFPK